MRHGVVCADVKRHVRPHQEENESGLVKHSGFLVGEIKRHTEERTVGMVVNRRAGEEKSVGIERSTGQRAVVNHWMGDASQEAFLCVVESRTGGGVYRQFVCSLPCALLGEQA